MKIIPMILSFIVGRLNSKPSKGLRETAVEIFDEITFRSRNIVTLTLGGLGSVILLCGGLFIAILDGTTQFDRNGVIAWTATLGAGVLLVALAGLSFSFVFIRAWPRATRSRSQPASRGTPETSPLETALATLVMDFVKERQASRKTLSEAEFTPHPPEPSHPKNEEPRSPLH